MVFSVIFESHQGLANTIITNLGGNMVNWLGGNNLATTLGKGFFSPDNTLFTPQWFTSMIVLMVYIVWNSLPFKILILLSALQGIDKQYYQAAQIDGSSKMRIFTKITVPLLSPQIFYLLITSFIGAFKEYTSVVAILVIMLNRLVKEIIWLLLFGIFIKNQRGWYHDGICGSRSCGIIYNYYVFYLD